MEFGGCFYCLHGEGLCPIHSSVKTITTTSQGTDTTHIHKKRYSSQEAFFDEEQSKKARDEALWTEYAKAALAGLMADTIVDKFEIRAEAVEKQADAMLTVHKKRWRDE